MAIAIFGEEIRPPYAIDSYDYGGAFPLTQNVLVTQTSPDANTSLYFGTAGPVYRAMIHAVALGADCFAALYSVNVGTLVATQLSTPATIPNVPYQIPLIDLGDAIPAASSAEQMVLRIWSPSGEGCIWRDGYAYCRPDVWLSADHPHPDTIAVVEAAPDGEVPSIVNDLVMEPYFADGFDDPFFSDPQPFILVPAPDHQEVVKVCLIAGGIDLGSDTQEPHHPNPTVFGPEGEPYGVYIGNGNDVGTPIFYTQPTGSAAARDQTDPPFFAWQLGEVAMSNPQEEQQLLPPPSMGVYVGGGNITNPGDEIIVMVTGGAEIRAGKRDCVFVEEETVYQVGPGDGVFIPAHEIELPGPGEEDLTPVWVPEQHYHPCLYPPNGSCWDVIIPAHWEYPDAEGVHSHTVTIPDMWILPPGTVGTSPVVIPAHWECVDTDEFLYAYARLASGYFVVSKGVKKVELECDGTLDLVWTHDEAGAIESYDLRIYRGVGGPLVATITNITSPYTVDPGYVPPFGAIGGDEYFLAIRANYFDGSWTEDGCFYFPGAAAGGGTVAHRFNPS